MDDLIRASALLTNDEDEEEEEFPESENEAVGDLGEEEGGVDAETDQW